MTANRLVTPTAADLAVPAQRPSHAALSSVAATVTIPADRVRWSDFSALLQRGVFAPAPASCSIQEFLTGELGLDPAYVRDRIATVFLDGMVVDDLDVAILRPGSTLTLSAAMPGLVGATLRKGGFYKAMRSEISWTQGGEATLPPDVPPGTARIKLFNLILREVGPALLARGIVLDLLDAMEYLSGWCDDVVGLPDSARIFVHVSAA